MSLIWYLPIRHQLTHPIYIPLLVSLAEYAAMFFLVGPILIDYPGTSLLIMLPVLVAVFFIGRLFVALDMLKTVFFFLWGATLTSFSPAFTHTATSAMSFLETPLGDNISVVITQIILSLLMTLIVFLLTRNWDTAFLTEPDVPAGLWIAFLCIPVLIFHQNVVLIASDPLSVVTDRELYSRVMMLVGNFLLFAFVTGIFYFIANMYVKNARVMEEKHMLELRQSQYNDIIRNVADTNKTLHDFKHTLNTLKSMAAESGNEDMIQYLKTLDEAIPSGTNLMNYCKNPAINSVLNHYAYRAKREEVPIKLQIDIPETLPISDPELCSMLGNIMENAIDACKNISQEFRQFDLSMVEKAGNLYIVASNTFDGKIRKNGDKFLSTKHDGFGIGISSIRETVERYDGTVKIHYKDNRFFTDIVITNLATKNKC